RKSTSPTAARTPTSPTSREGRRATSRSGSTRSRSASGSGSEKLGLRRLLRGGRGLELLPVLHERAEVALVLREGHELEVEPRPVADEVQEQARRAAVALDERVHVEELVVHLPGEDVLRAGALEAEVHDVEDAPHAPRDVVRRDRRHGLVVERAL